MSGSEMAREKEKVAAKMREKQAAGKYLCSSPLLLQGFILKENENLTTFCSRCEESR